MTALSRHASRLLFCLLGALAVLVGLTAPAYAIPAAQGPTGGGTVLTITGTNFYGLSTVTFDGAPATRRRGSRRTGSP